MGMAWFCTSLTAVPAHPSHAVDNVTCVGFSRIAYKALGVLGPFSKNLTADWRWKGFMFTKPLSVITKASGMT